nr:MAG: ORF1 [Torque teno midi virus]UHK07314.1 MAG: ORF1 [Torque teno midi virus]
MPFWWRRRRRPWYPAWRKRRRFGRYKRRKTRRFRRRRTRRSTRRRRRGRKKVRRKRATLPVRQWQPDSIVLCKIKGYGTLVLGAQGTQYLCYTNQKTAWTPPQYPAGGGFGIEVFTLQYLYSQYILRNNIWTKTNEYKDLCRYLKCRFTFYRHQNVDFIIWYSRQPPFKLDKYIYPSIHPQQLLLRRKKIVLLSKKTNPKGKLTKKITIRPPKQMITKWFFTQQFCTADLLQLAAAATSFSWPKLGCCNENLIVSVYYLNTQFFQDSTWAQTHQTNTPWKPYSTIPDGLTFKYKQGNQTLTFKPDTTSYWNSISYDKGWFNKGVLQAYEVILSSGTQTYGALPIVAARYNPAIDDGEGNEIYLVSTITGHYTKPQNDPIITFNNMPLWLAFYGYWSYIEKQKTISFMNQHMFVVKSKYILPQPTTATQQYFPFVDLNFIQGNNPYKAYIPYADKKYWYPSAFHQVETINNFVQCGPYIPKLGNDRESTWELPYSYCFYFKWGGPEITDQPVADPKKQEQYVVPDTLQQTIQISNPLKQTTEAMLHSWDFRRGFVTNRAFKRMCENLPSDTDIQTDAEYSPHKKKLKTGELPTMQEETQKIQSYLQALSEESICQETEEAPDLLQLIQQQRHEQQNLKLNILKLIQDLKLKQRMLQLQTGLLD